MFAINDMESSDKEEEEQFIDWAGIAHNRYSAAPVALVQENTCMGMHSWRVAKKKKKSL